MAKRQSRNQYRQDEPQPVARRNRLLPVLGLLLLAGTVGWLVWSFRSLPLLLSQADFPLKKIRIASTFHHLDAQRIRALITPLVRRGFLGADMDTIRQALLAQPWVAAVAVRRVWPDLLDVSITEQQALAHWGARALLNARGERFRPQQVTVVASDLPWLNGPPGSERQVLMQFYQINNSLAPLVLHVRHLRLDARRSWGLTLDNGLRLALGKEQIQQRMQRFVRFYHKLMTTRQQDIEEIDMRYAHGFAVRWHTAGKGRSDGALS